MGPVRVEGNGRKKPKVSIGLPVFNGEKFLPKTLDSLLNQTYKDFELVISDNASTDNTEAICREYAAKDERIRYYRNTENIGMPENFERAFRLSTGEYFKWAMADDLCMPEFLTRCVDVLNNDPNVVIACTKSCFYRWYRKVSVEPRARMEFAVGVSARTVSRRHINRWSLGQWGCTFWRNEVNGSLEHKGATELCRWRQAHAWRTEPTWQVFGNTRAFACAKKTCGIVR